ncbi:DUF1311 domain-containing protein [Acinetobacter gyllenbergii]|nr:DUF1311 domain-containing protein [Acinetobacter gyllenbergii]
MRVFIGLYLIWLTMYVYADKNILTCKPESTVFNDILNCYLIEYKENDKELNSVYKNKISKLSQDEKEKLKTSQKNWVKKKEKLCIANEDEFGRESHFEAIACQTEMTKERISFLKRY